VTLSWWREGRENGEGWKFDKADDDSNNEEKKKHSSLLLNPFSCVLFCGRQQKKADRKTIKTGSEKREAR
jgi:hypothetical protein